MIKPRKTKQLDIDALTAAAECLKTLAHPHRLQIVQLLLTGKELSVNEIAEECDLNQPTTSDHLRLMQRCGFLRSQKERTNRLLLGVRTTSSRHHEVHAD